MKITNGIVEVQVDDDKAVYSPFLRVVMDNLDSGLFDVDLLEEAVLIDRVDGDVLKNFIYFLENGIVLKMEDEDEEFYDYMGFPNLNIYPLDYWKIKLRDNWIRDNMYKLKLWEQDKYYGLVEVELKEDRLDEYEGMLDPYIDITRENLGTNLIVAGGAALFLSGAIEKLKDIDLFFLSSERDSVGIIREFISKPGSYRAHPDIVTSNNAVTINSKIQFILRLYKSPTEIVHGFDLDSVGILYDGDKLWATERTMYAIDNRMNWFDPARASPSYTSRLLKYHLRGFRVMLPSFDLNMLNEDLVTSDVDKLMKKYLAMGRDYAGDIREMVNSSLFQSKLAAMSNIPIRTAASVALMGGRIPPRLTGTVESLMNNAARGTVLEMDRDFYYVANYLEGLPPIPISDHRYLYMVYQEANPADVTDLIEDGFETLSSILGIDMYPDDYPFIRDDLLSWYKPGVYNRGQVVGIISRLINSRIKKPRPSRMLRRDTGQAKHDSTMYTDIFSTDNASLLILAYAYDIVYIIDTSDYLGGEPVFDFKTKNTDAYLYLLDKLDNSGIKFAKQDPMSQLTSTFNPVLISDVQDFYNESNYYAKKHRRLIFEPLISYE